MKKYFFYSQGTSPEAQRLAQQIKDKLGVLQNDIEDAIQHQAITGGKKPNITFAGKRDQVQEWLHNPSGDPSGLGKPSMLFRAAELGKRPSLSPSSSFLTKA